MQIVQIKNSNPKEHIFNVKTLGLAANQQSHKKIQKNTGKSDSKIIASMCTYSVGTYPPSPPPPPHLHLPKNVNGIIVKSNHPHCSGTLYHHQDSTSHCLLWYPLLRSHFACTHLLSPPSMASNGLYIIFP